MKGGVLCLLLTLGAVLHGETIDRIALTIGSKAITELQIDEELRVTALLNHRPVFRSETARREAATRMVEQMLISRETEVSHFPAPSANDIDTYEAQIERDYGGSGSLNAALQQYGLTLPELRSHLEHQLATLRFISFRFQPELPSNSADAERRTDEALNVWLKEARRRSSVVYLDKALEK